MAKQSNAAAGQNTPQEPNDILLLHDKLDKVLKAISEFDENGNHKTVPFDEKNRNSLLKLDKQSNWLETFWKNLVSQFKDPTLFNLISIKESQMDDPKIKKALKDLADGKETKAVKEFLEKYEIRAKGPEQAQGDGIDWDALAKQGITREGLEKIGMLDAFMAKQAKQAPAQEQNYRFSESLINWEELKNMGVSREYLAQRGLLDQLLKGYKTNELVPLTIRTGPVVARMEARLALINMDGENKILMYGVKQKPDFDRAYMGHIFSADDKRNLLETGNMGRTVELKHRDGEYAMSFVSLDRLTNDIIATKEKDVYIPNEIKNIILSEHEINDLKEGKQIRLEGLIAKSGREYPATIQINAERRGIEYIFESDKLFNAQKLGEVELTEKQRNELNEGKTVLVENMIGKDSGALYDRFVKLDEATGRPLFFRFNPDSPEDARQVIIPKELGGVKLTAEDRLDLREGRAIFVKDMTTRSGEERSSFVKVDVRTGNVMYSNSPTDFNERPAFKVPDEIHGAKLTALQKAQLQDGKAVLIDGIKGFDGKTISQYARVNREQTQIQMFNDNPDRKREVSRRNVVAERQDQGQSQKKGRGVQ